LQQQAERWRQRLLRRFCQRQARRCLARVRPAAAIRAGLVFIALSTLAMGLGNSFVLWMVLRTAAGIASAWVLVFVSAWALDRLALAGRSDLSGTVYAGVGTGIAVAGMACLACMTLHARSADAWLALAAISIAVTAAIWPLLQSDSTSNPGPAPAAAQSVRSGTEPGWSAEHWRLVVCYGAFGFGYIIPATFLPAMAKQIVPDPQLFGWAWPAFGAAAAVSTIFAAQMKQRFSQRALWIGGHVVMAAGVVLPLVVPGFAGIIAAALLVGGTFMAITMAGMLEARKVAGSDSRALMAAMTSAFAAGQILGPVSVSFLARSTGGFAPALILAAATLAISAFALIERTEKERG